MLYSISFHIFITFFFWWHWGLNSGPHACYVTIEPLPQSLVTCFVLCYTIVLNWLYVLTNSSAYSPFFETMSSQLENSPLWFIFQSVEAVPLTHSVCLCMFVSCTTWAMTSLGFKILGPNLFIKKFKKDIFVVWNLVLHIWRYLCPLFLCTRNVLFFLHSYQ
jgi:hypothetical protein